MNIMSDVGTERIVTLSEISALSCPNEVLHQIVVLLEHNDAPIL